MSHTIETLRNKKLLCISNKKKIKQYFTNSITITILNTYTYIHTYTQFDIFLASCCYTMYIDKLVFSNLLYH